ncbi:SGNH/GDSL hydrolase family protein [Paenibacillus woosongensis]|uniref:SGNH/GDSL hydrolase family protein n=1 Tax=Paenibacillus woosongensis TaxID=307580 RepID=A0AA95L2C6_9BACL|nr:SGNH/GDSL hydrolase family protein [Paenibacillus woosongensis]WHX49452.1 SGNH/GDSL hydrolase family protein [Paenibacillus woosongensis]
MIYTALGDSITFGENASSFAKAYPRVAASLVNASSSHKVIGYVLARPGWNTLDLLDAAAWQGSSVISRSAVVSVWIGGVDLANAALSALASKQVLDAKRIVARYKRNLHAILTQIQNTSPARILCCTQYNPFPNSPLAAKAISGLNQTTKEVAQSYNAKVIPTHLWFEGKQSQLIYGYRKGKIEDALGGFLPIHPNDRGHQVIAKGLAPYLALNK